MVSGDCVSKTEHFVNIGCESKHVLLLVALVKLYAPSNDRNSLGDFDSWAEMSVRVWKGVVLVNKC